MAILSEVQKAYFAGFFDGEGCLLATRSDTGIVLRITVAQRTEEILQTFQKAFGGKVEPHNVQYFRWLLYKQRDIRDFLKSILSYVIVKKPSVELGLLWFEHIQRYSGRDLPEDEILFREEILDIIHKLNERIPRERS